MIYLENEDLYSVIQERLIGESLALPSGVNLDDNSILDDIESKAIDFVKSYISGLYNVTEIFETPIRNGVLVQIIASIVVYRSVRRNAARKVPEDLITIYNDAKKDLDRIQSGAMKLINCPVLTNEDGTSTSPMYGNNTNDYNFI